MHPHPAIAPVRVSPLTSVGSAAVSLAEDAGATAALAFDGLRSLLFPRGAAPPLGRAVRNQLRWLIGAGLPLVGLVHVGMGSFLSMQAFFGATFAEGTGAVVGIGLVRNVSPLLAGFVSAGLLAAHTVAELRNTRRQDLDLEPSWVPDRSVILGLTADDRPAPEPGRIAAPRILAAMIAGPVLALFGALIGIAIGWQVSSSLLDIPGGVYFGRFAELLWLRDVLGLVVKSMAYPAVGALFACREGLRDHPRDTIQAGSLRAVCWSLCVILALNLSWFFAAYIIGPPFGPTLLEPPRA